MTNLNRTLAATEGLQIGGLFLTAWGPVVACLGALTFAGCGLTAAARSDFAYPPWDAILAPVGLFAAGLAPMIGAGLIVWTARHSLSPAERRSQLVGASLSAVLFFPVLLLVRAFT